MSVTEDYLKKYYPQIAMSGNSLYTPMFENRGVFDPLEMKKKRLMTIEDIINEEPSTNVVRKYFKRKIDQINEKNDDAEEEFLKELDELDK